MSNGYGFLKLYKVPSIAANTTNELTVSSFQDDMDRINGANVILIYNEDAVIYDIILDRNVDAAVRIPAGSATAPSTLTMNGTTFKRIQVKNVDAAVAGTADKLRLTVQKDLNSEQS